MVSPRKDESKEDYEARNRAYSKAYHRAHRDECLAKMKINDAARYANSVYRAYKVAKACRWQEENRARATENKKRSAARLKGVPVAHLDCMRL